MITRDTHSMTIIDEHDGRAIVEITEDGAATQRYHRFYVVRIDRDSHQVYSTVPADYPLGGGTWVGHISVGGVAYVSTGRTLTTARRWMARLIKEENEIFA